MKIGIILTPDVRSKAYIQKSIKHNIHFENIILMNDNRKEQIFLPEVTKLSEKMGFNISETVKNTLDKKNISYNEFPFVDINDPKLVNYLKNLDVDYWIFSGGGILKNEILSLKTKFIHLHPGIVPDYRGSTCFYYSILNENYAGVTSFIMSKGLDMGDIIFQKRFDKPNYQYLDEIYDPHIRSETLIELLKNETLLEKEKMVQNSNEGETYFIIHPVLKHIAIQKCLND